jgi:hypothetical protein
MQTFLPTYTTILISVHALCLTRRDTSLTREYAVPTVVSLQARQFVFAGISIYIERIPNLTTHGASFAAFLAHCFGASFGVSFGALFGALFGA